MRLISAILISGLLLTAGVSQAADGGAKGGAQRCACLACYSLEPSGLSLAGLRDKPAGKTASFARHSEGLKSADFRGIEDKLVALLKLARAPGGDKRAVEQRFVPAAFSRAAPPTARLGARRCPRAANYHCGDSQCVTTAGGATTPFWEMNVRLKLDARVAGSAPGKPVVAVAGMQGDCVPVIFSGVEEIKRSIEENC